jgi:flagellar basal body rod protein FlgF
MNAMVQMIKDARSYEMYVKVMKNARELSQSSASVVRMDG